MSCVSRSSTSYARLVRGYRAWGTFGTTAAPTQAPRRMKAAHARGAEVLGTQQCRLPVPWAWLGVWDRTARAAEPY